MKSVFRGRAVSRLPSVVTAVVAALTVSVVVVPTAAAQDGPRVVGVRDLTPTHSVVDVYSPAMDKVVSNDVLRPRGGGAAPTLYLLNGALGNEDGVGWINNSGAVGFFADKAVNVVLPIGGRLSFYTDWLADDALIGRNKWQTYLTAELPAVMDRHLGSTRRNAVAGVSMSGGPALDLAVQAPGLYRAAASLSGCPASSHPLAQAAISVMIGGALTNPFAMWGVPGAPGWTQHDPAQNAHRLRGTAVYAASASGMPGPVDDIPAGSPFPVGGAAVEAMVNVCTGLFADAVRAAGVPATISMRDHGSHSWALFEDELRDAWYSTIAPALGTR